MEADQIRRAILCETVQAPWDGSFSEALPPAGCWVIGGAMGLRTYVKKRPRWLTRVFVRWLFEWKWEEGNEPQVKYKKERAYDFTNDDIRRHRNQR